MTEQNNETFNLEAPAINNYINLILQDMRTYQEWVSRKYDRGVASIHRTVLSLKRLISDMPPKGQDFIKEKIPELQSLDDILKIEDYEATDAVYQIALSWLWPNLLELQLNTAKPAYQNPGHLENKKK